MEKILKNKKNDTNQAEGPLVELTYEEYISSIYHPCCENGIKEMVARECEGNIKTEQGRNIILQQLENEK